MAIVISGTDNSIKKSDNTAGIGIGGRPSFHATRTLGHIYGNGGSDIVIPFDNVKYNYGGGYNALTGRFTAPFTGVYYFQSEIISYR